MGALFNQRNPLLQYVIPAILTNTCIFLFTIIDGIFVGNGVGTDSLGAVNIAMPFVMVATIISTVLNIFLDWLFIFPMEMGIMGAALATGISQTVAWLIVLMHFIQKKGDLRIKAYKPDGSLYRKVLFRGLPEMIAQFATPVTTICLNHVLIQNLGDLGVNVFAIISYVASFAMSVLFGASEGLQPLFGQSYGAKEEKDLRYYLRSGMVICFAGSA